MALQGNGEPKHTLGKQQLMARSILAASTEMKHIIHCSGLQLPPLAWNDGYLGFGFGFGYRSDSDASTGT